jgi:hypothetical protein
MMQGKSFAKLVAAALLATITSAAAAPDADKNFKNELLATFGNWRISRIQASNSITLSASSKGAAAGWFELQCDPSKSYAVLIPFLEPPKAAHLKTTVWSDAHDPQEIDVPVFTQFVGLGMSNAPRSKEVVATFMDVLMSAHRFFAFSYGTTTFEFDATHLPAARKRFFDYCGRL